MFRSVSLKTALTQPLKTQGLYYHKISRLYNTGLWDKANEDLYHINRLRLEIEDLAKKGIGNLHTSEVPKSVLDFFTSEGFYVESRTARNETGVCIDWTEPVKDLGLFK